MHFTKLQCNGKTAEEIMFHTHQSKLFYVGFSAYFGSLQNVQVKVVGIENTKKISFSNTHLQ